MIFEDDKSCRHMVLKITEKVSFTLAIEYRKCPNLKIQMRHFE